MVKPFVLTVLVIIGLFLVVILVSAGHLVQSGSVSIASSVAPAATVTGLADCDSDQRSLIDNQLNPALQRFTDALALASQTPRLALAEPIAQMQAARRDFLAARPPDCAAQWAAWTVAGMGDAITAYIDFLGNQDDAAVHQLLSRATSELQQAQVALH